MGATRTLSSFVFEPPPYVIGLFFLDVCREGTWKEVKLAYWQTHFSGRPASADILYLPDVDAPFEGDTFLCFNCHARHHSAKA